MIRPRGPSVADLLFSKVGMLPKTQWSVVGVSILAGVVAAAHIGKAPPVIPVLRADLGLGLVAAGWVATMFNVLGAICGCTLGMAGDVLGHRRSVFLGFVLLAVGGVTGALSSDQTMLLVGRLVEGVGFISVVVSCPGLIMAATAPQDMRLTFGLLGTYMPLGVATALFAAPYAEQLFGWRGLWLALALISLAMIPSLGWVTRSLPLHRRPAPRDGSKGGWGDLLSTLRRPGLWWLGAAFATYTVQWSTLLVWLPSVLVETRHLGVAAASSLTAIIAAMNAPGGVIGAWLLHRRVPRGALIVGANVVMGLCFVGIFSPALPDVVTFSLCLVFSTVGGILPASILSGSAVHASGPGQIGAANGMLIQGSNIGQLVGPLGAAALVSHTGGWDSVLWLMVVSAVLGGLAGLQAGRKERLLPSL